ncbi:hypothetical protein R6L23_07410 [Streptomyces sp. SR27]|nr:hypothetical protein [Streptomyces sp. SR27]MDV9188045.1 hypothetical protein [Streptomyces sp. SR27]
MNPTTPEEDHVPLAPLPDSPLAGAAVELLTSTAPPTLVAHS